MRERFILWWILWNKTINHENTKGPFTSNVSVDSRSIFSSWTQFCQICQLCIECLSEYLSSLTTHFNFKYVPFHSYKNNLTCIENCGNNICLLILLVEHLTFVQFYFINMYKDGRSDRMRIQGEKFGWHQRWHLKGIHWFQLHHSHQASVSASRLASKLKWVLDRSKSVIASVNVVRRYELRLK